MNLFRLGRLVALVGWSAGMAVAARAQQSVVSNAKGDASSTTEILSRRVSVHLSVRGCAGRERWTTRRTGCGALYAAANAGEGPDQRARLREKRSSRSSGVSAAILATQSAEKKSAVGASVTGTTACVIVSS